jgi:hypothetical protein
MKNTKTAKSKISELRKLNGIKLITNTNSMRGGSVQRFALLEGVCENGEWSPMC